MSVQPTGQSNNQYFSITNNQLKRVSKKDQDIAEIASLALAKSNDEEINQKSNEIFQALEQKIKKWEKSSFLKKLYVKIASLPIMEHIFPIIYKKANTYVSALETLARCYEQGFGVDKDQKKALELIKHAAEAGDENAMYRFALHLKSEIENKSGEANKTNSAIEIEELEKQKRVWLEKASDKGHPQAMEELVKLYREKKVYDETQIEALIEKAAKKGNPMAMKALGDKYYKADRQSVKAWELYNKAYEKHYPPAIKVFQDNERPAILEREDKRYPDHKRLADAGYKEYMYHIAKYHQRYHSERDNDAIISWYTAAAEKGYPAANLELGDIYKKSAESDNPQEDAAEKAVKYYEAAANAPYGLIKGTVWLYTDEQRCQAMRELTEIYSNGLGSVQKDENKVFEWYKKAAELGDIRANKFLGDYYLQLTPENLENKQKAFDHYSKAARPRLMDSSERDDFAAAAFQGAEMLMKGIGVDKNVDKALQYYHEAATNGSVKAMLALGQYYESKDSYKAYEYYSQAGNKKDPTGLESMARLIREKKVE